MKLSKFLILFCLGISFGISAQERIYFNDFESGNLDVATYIGQPEISDHISFSVWTNNSKENFSEQTGVDGTRGISITGSGEISIFFQIDIEPGYELDLTGYSYWLRKTKANQAWTFYVNGDPYANGATTLAGGYTTGNLNPGLTNQTGTLNLEFRVNGIGNGFYVLDNFELFGEVRKICNEPLITVQPNPANVCNGDYVAFTVETISGETIIYQWQILIDGSWEDLSDDLIYSGVNTNTLSIENTELAYNQNLYRCVVVIDGCEEESNPAELSVIALPETEPIMYNN